MTRETKVGLLVGTGIILLIGIIVSDHLSVVSRQPSAELGRMAHQAQDGINEMGIAEPAGQGIAMIPGNELRLPDQLDGPRQTDQRQNDGGITTGIRAWVDTPSDFVGPTGEIHVRPMPEGNAAPEPRGGTAVQSPTDAPAGQTVHFVKAGESLWQIAQKYYGDGTHWNAIYEANQSAIGENNGIREGVRLVIPADNRPRAVAHNDSQDPGVVGGPVNEQGVQGVALGGNGNGPVEQVAEIDPAPPSGRTVTVVSGDTLMKLAARHLGSGQRWREILELNRGQLRSPQDLQIGMTLRMPEAGAPAPVRETRAPATRTETRITEPREIPRPRNESATPRRDDNPGRLTYTVQSGDTLMSIANRKLGDRNRWREIYNANKSQLASPDSLKLGQKLMIPVG